MTNRRRRPYEVAEAPADDQAGGEGEAVAGDHPLDRRRAGVQGELQRGHRDVDDEEVEDDQEDAGEDDRQDEWSR